MVSALGGLFLVAALVGAIMLAWRNPVVEARHAVRDGSTLLYDGSYTEAVSLLEDTLPRYDSPELRLNLSYAYLARRDGERSIRQARAAASSARNELRPAALAQLGRALAFSGQRDEALNAWEEAVVAASAYPNLARPQLEARSSLWHSGMLHWRNMDWPAARRSFESLLSGDDLYARSAALKLAQLDAPTSAPDAERLLALAVPASDQANATATTLPNLRVPGLREGIPPDEIKIASEELRRTLREANVAPTTDDSALALLWGSFYLQQGESDLAREYLQRAVDLQPDSAPGQVRLGLLLLTLGEEEAAFAHISRAAELDANDPLPHYVLAQIYLGRKDWAGAEGEFAFLRRLEPGSIDLHMQLAEYHRLRGDYDKAEDSYIDAVAAQQIGPVITGNPGLRLADPALTLARFYTDVRGLGCEKGLPAGRQVAALHPDDPAAHDAVGWALVICREPEDALTPLDLAVKDAPEVPRYRYHRAKAYSLLARYGDARAEYKRVVNLDPGGPWEQLALNDLAALPPTPAEN
ncbi:MAG: tetratricopeptide repeat protein [Chloroflexia bacterium]